MTHNAAASVDNSTTRGQSSSFVEPSQFESILEQLQRGVRALHFDSVQLVHGELRVCDKERQMGCEYGSVKLEEVLSDVAAFLIWDERRRAHNLLEVQPGGDVIVLVFQGTVHHAAEFAAAFDSTSLLSKVFDRADHRYKSSDVTSGWPTLGSILCLNGFIPPDALCSSTPILVFAEGLAGQLPWVLPLWEHVWQTSPQVSNGADLSCSYASGNITAPLTMKNHWLNNPGPSSALASSINYKTQLLSSLSNCWLNSTGRNQNSSGRLPNFVAVDFAGVGDLVDVAFQINSGDSDGSASFRERLLREWVFMTTPRADGNYSTAQNMLFLFFAIVCCVGVVYPCLLTCMWRLRQSNTIFSRVIPVE
jgi:hypothetical protein